MTDAEVIYLRVRRADITYIQLLIESYEGIGIVRTLDRHAAIIVVLAAPDFTGTVRDVLAEISWQIPCVEIAKPAVASEDWLLAPDVDDTA
jgi:hypothetical protein